MHEPNQPNQLWKTSSKVISSRHLHSAIDLIGICSKEGAELHFVELSSTNSMGTDVNKPLWQPRGTEDTNTARFISFVNKRHNLELRSYEDLHRWSVGDTSFDAFWRDAYEWLELAPPGSKKVGQMLHTQVMKIESHGRCYALMENERLTRSARLASRVNTPIPAP
jgi:hypothetical protein